MEKPEDNRVGERLGLPEAGAEMAGTVATLKGLAEDGQGLCLGNI